MGAAKSRFSISCNLELLPFWKSGLGRTPPPVPGSKNILGGWKYINSDTGEFFTNETDVGSSVETLLKKIENKKYKPREYFIKNYSVANAGRTLKKWLYENFRDKLNIDPKNIDYISPEFNKKDFQPCYQVGSEKNNN